MDIEEKCFDQHFFEGNARDGGGYVLLLRQGSLEGGVDRRDLGWKWEK